jgi:hypothetical protein
VGRIGRDERGVRRRERMPDRERSKGGWVAGRLHLSVAMGPAPLSLEAALVGVHGTGPPGGAEAAGGSGGAAEAETSGPRVIEGSDMGRCCWSAARFGETNVSCWLKASDIPRGERAAAAAVAAAVAAAPPPPGEGFGRPLMCGLAGAPESAPMVR